jgi:3-oxoacyl-[acyl-carrier-protein] synthase-3
VVVTAEEGEAGVLSTHLFTDGSLTELLTIPAGGSRLPTSAETVAERKHYVSMEGKEVFRFAVRYLSQAAELALSRNGMAPGDVDLVVAHQANLRILDAVSKRVKIPLDRFVLNIARYGNTSSASIPIALDEAVRDGRVKRGDLILFTAFGAGLTWGAALVRW